MTPGSTPTGGGSAGATEPVSTEPVTTEPVTTEPVTTEPVTVPDRARGAAPVAPDRPVLRRGRRRLAARALSLLCFLLTAAASTGLHALAAVRPGAPVATVGEAQLAVATFVERGLDLAVDPLPLGDRLAAIQLAIVQLLLPLAGVPVVDAARWACLALGALSALLAWPVLRGLGVSVPSTVFGVSLLGATLPALGLHAGISAAAPAAVWLMIAAWFAVRQWGRAALVAALIAALTAPLAGAALLAMGAHLVLGRILRVPGRPLVGGLLGLAALGLAASAAGSGPLAGAAGPVLGTGVAVLGVLVGLVVVGLAWRSADWLRPVLTAAVPLLLAALVPGPSRATAALLAAPVLVVAVGLLLDQVGEWLPNRAVAGLGVVALLGAVLVSTPYTLANRSPAPPDANALISWLNSEPQPGTPVRADDLDRAELLLVGFPAGRLRGPDEPPAPGELRLISDRPTGGSTGSGPVGCPGLTTVAAAPRGTGGAPGAVCRTDGNADSVAAEGVRRIRLGAALADNPALQLSPAAAAALRAGQVDPRLMLVLAAMTSAHRVAVDDFPAVPLDTPAVPRRQAVLTLIDGGAPASSELLRTWLTAQQPPFLPSTIRPAGSALLVGYPAPPLSGLLSE